MKNNKCTESRGEKNTKLKTENYKCIIQMNFELDESILNFIYGISGNGKTLICSLGTRQQSYLMLLCQNKYNNKDELS